MAKGSPRAPRREPKGAKGSPKGAEWEPKGPKMEAKGRQREPKGSQRTTQMHPKTDQGATSEKCHQKVTKRGVSGFPGGSQKPPFYSRSGPGPSKNTSREGFRRKHENTMENEPEKVRFSEERNVLKRDKHGTGDEFGVFTVFRKKTENGSS